MMQIKEEINEKISKEAERRRVQKFNQDLSKDVASKKVAAKENVKVKEREEKNSDKSSENSSGRDKLEKNNVAESASKNGVYEVDAGVSDVVHEKKVEDKATAEKVNGTISGDEQRSQKAAVGNCTKCNFYSMTAEELIEHMNINHGAHGN